MKLIVLQPFEWAHEHVRVVAYAAGDEIETEDADLIEVATREGWAKDAAAPEKQPAPKGGKAKAAPEASE